MKRNQSLVLDKRDKQILYLLDLNGRLSYSQVAKHLGISKQVALYRIERLEKEGFIKGYYTMIDSSRLGFTTFRVYLKFRNADVTKRITITNRLKEQNSIWAVIGLAGKWDLALGVSVKDIYKFYEIWEEVLEEYLPLISDYKISIYSPIYHYSKSYLVDAKDTSSVRVLGGGEPASIDSIDLKLLTLLSKNARISLLDLSEKINLTPEALSHRIKQLEKKKVIQGYRAMIDVSKIGYEFYKAEIRLTSYKKIKDILDFCHSHPNIYQVDKTIGGETLEVEFHVESLRQMLSILDEFERSFPNVVERFDYLTVLNEEKTTYMPHL